MGTETFQRAVPHWTRFGRRVDASIAVVLAVMATAASVAVITVGVCGVYNDDGLYVSTAKALASGAGYRLIDLPGAPFQTRYPILYPGVLAIIWRLWPAFPNNLLALQGFSVLCGAGAIGLGYLYTVRVQHCPRPVAAAAIAICATSPIFAYFSTQTLSDIPFAFCLIVVLWTIAAELNRPLPGHRLSQIGVGLMIALPSLVRLIGLAIVLPALWSLWRRKKGISWYVAGAALPLVLWFGWVFAVRYGAAPVRVALNNPDSWDWLSHAWQGKLAVPPYNLVRLTLAAAAMLPDDWWVRAGLWFSIAGLVAWTRALRGGRSALAPILIAYAAVVMFWPWPSDRFVLPLWPLLAPFLFEPLYRRIGSVALAAIVAAAIVGNVNGLVQMAARNASSHYPMQYPESAPASWPSYERVFAWERGHTNEQDVLIAQMDPMLFLYTGRHAIRAFETNPIALFYGDRKSPSIGTVDDLVALLKRSHARHLVLTPGTGFAEDRPFVMLVDQLRSTYPSCLSTSYRDDHDWRFAVFSIEPAQCGWDEATRRAGGKEAPTP